MVDQECQSVANGTHETLQSENAEPGSISLMIQRLREDKDQNAASDLYHRCFKKLVATLRSHINTKVQAIESSEEAAQFVLSEVLRKIEDKRLPKLADRKSLWVLMLSIGETRSKQVWRDETAGKRDVRRQQGQVSLPKESGGSLIPFDPTCDSIPSSVVVEVKDMIEYLGRQFSAKEYKALLIWELQGYDPSEMKDMLEKKLGREIGESSVRRWRRLMREELRAHYPDEYPNL